MDQVPIIRGINHGPSADLKSKYLPVKGIEFEPSPDGSVPAQMDDIKIMIGQNGVFVIGKTRDTKQAVSFFRPWNRFIQIDFNVPPVVAKPTEAPKNEVK